MRDLDVKASAQDHTPGEKDMDTQSLISETSKPASFLHAVLPKSGWGARQAVTLDVQSTKWLRRVPQLRHSWPLWDVEASLGVLPAPTSTPVNTDNPEASRLSVNTSPEISRDLECTWHS